MKIHGIGTDIANINIGSLLFKKEYHRIIPFNTTETNPYFYTVNGTNQPIKYYGKEYSLLPSINDQVYLKAVILES